MKNNFIKYVCRFCQQELLTAAFFPPHCTCEGYTQATQLWVQEYHLQNNNKKAFTSTEYDKLHPKVFDGERLIKDKDATHKLKLEARRYKDTVGVVAWKPFPYKSSEDLVEDPEGAGIAFDLTHPEAEALWDLLNEYLKK